jgi:hypothetical protein
MKAMSKLHDWMLEVLNLSFDAGSCRLAVRCIERSVQLDAETEHWVGNRRLLQNVQRLKHDRVQFSVDWINTDH